jgi:hypothetical protein
MQTMKIPTTEIGIVKAAPERYFQFSVQPGMAALIMKYGLIGSVVYPLAYARAIDDDDMIQDMLT